MRSRARIILLIIVYQSQVIMCIDTECSLRERLQVADEAGLCFGNIATHVYTFGSHIRQGITFVYIEIGTTRNSRSKCHVIVYPVQVNINRFQVTLRQTSFLTSRISRNNLLISSYRLIVFIILIIQQTDFIGSTTRQRTFRITLYQQRITLDGIRIIFHLYKSTSLFIQCIVYVLRCWESGNQTVQQFDLLSILTLQAFDNTLLKQRVVRERHRIAGCLSILSIGRIKASCIEVTVTHSVINICHHIVLQPDTRFRATSKPSQCLIILFLFKCRIAQIIQSQRVLCTASVGSKFQELTIVGCSSIVLLQTIFGFTPPIISIRLCLLVIAPQLKRLRKIVNGIFKSSLRESLRSQTEQQLLLSLQNTSSRMTDFRYRIQGSHVAACIHINLYQVIVHLFRIGRIRELVQKTFEYRY